MDETIGPVFPNSGRTRGSMFLIISFLGKQQGEAKT
jgi:hypothetical protein